MKRLFLTAAAAMVAVLANAISIDGTRDGHAYVDLGLPSGTLWAICNVGAANVQDNGSYFAWGETAAKEGSAFTWSAYKWCNGTEKTLTKYCTDSSYGTVDNMTRLDSIDDAAAVNWGGSWRMPTGAQLQELDDECCKVWTDDYNGTGVAGLIFYKAKSQYHKGLFDNTLSYTLDDTHIFLPAASLYTKGVFYDDKVGSYRSASLDDNAVVDFSFSDNYESTGIFRERSAGTPVRAVCMKPVGAYTDGTADGHDYVDLGLASGTKWATANIGASVTDFVGDRYAWGETTTQSGNTYDWTTYKYCEGTISSITKYVTESKYGTVDGKTKLEAADDAAAVNWGGKWRTPLSADYSELLLGCYWVWTDNYNSTGVKGYIVYKAKKDSDKGYASMSGTTPDGSYSLDDAHIFLPVSGIGALGTIEDASTTGYYWLSDLYLSSGAARYFYFNGGGLYSDGIFRYCGMPVRPVMHKPLVLTVTANDDSYGTVSGSGSYAESDVKITAIPAAGFTFVKWSDGVTDAMRTVKLVSDSSFTALFSAPVYTDGSENGYGYVDLGLTSKTLWATCNVGASNPQDFGNRYAWGETEPQDEALYGWEDYQLSDWDGETFYKYVTNSFYGTVDNLTQLDSIDDAAATSLKGKWRMPASAQAMELLAECYWAWTDDYNFSGVDGYIVYKAKNSADKGRITYKDETPDSGYKLTDTHIFLPNTEGIFVSSCYWTSSLSTSTSYAQIIEVNPDGVMSEDYERRYPSSVRGVIPGVSPATRVDDASAASKSSVRKVLKDGSVYIIRDGSVFGVNGGRLK